MEKDLIIKLFYIFLISIAYSTQAFIQKYSLLTRHRKLKAEIPTTGEDHRTDSSLITFSSQALEHLNRVKKDKDLYLRMGVKNGGCSGMSYVMNIIQKNEVNEDDHVETFRNIHCVIDPKSLLFLYGLKLDYSDELIGGGFKFSNPNADVAW